MRKTGIIMVVAGLCFSLNVYMPFKDSHFRLTWEAATSCGACCHIPMVTMSCMAAFALGHIHLKLPLQGMS